jgi:hypothetical protein
MRPRDEVHPPLRGSLAEILFFNFIEIAHEPPSDDVRVSWR